MRPGFYPGLSYEEYAAIDAVRHSQLKEMAKSPLHYQHGLKHPRKDTDALRWGRIVHTATLEPHLLTDRYMAREYGMGDIVEWTGGDRRGKAWKAFKAQHEGRTIVKSSELAELVALKEQAALVASIVHTDPVSGPLLARGHQEGVLVWRDKRTGLPCKCRFDSGHFITFDKHLADLKTDARGLDRFDSTAARLLYHEQLAFYADGVSAVFNVQPPVHIIAVESEAPHDVVVYDLDDLTLDLGRTRYEELMDKLAACLKAGVWPGRANGQRVPLKLPAWAYPADDGDDGTWGAGAER